MLNILSCKFVDEVVIGAPWFVTEDLLKSFNIQLVIEGFPHFQEPIPKSYSLDSYKLAKDKGIYANFDLENKIVIDTIIERIMNNHESYLLL